LPPYRKNMLVFPRGDLDLNQGVLSAHFYRAKKGTRGTPT
jgi:hypothetical protein